MTKRQWDAENYTYDEILEMWYEFVFVKKAIGEFKDDEANE